MSGSNGRAALAGFLALSVTCAASLRLGARSENLTSSHDWPTKKFYAWEVGGGSTHRGLVRDGPPHSNWRLELVFYAFTSEHPGTTKFWTWEQGGGSSHTGIVRDHAPYFGSWSQKHVFYAFKSQEPGTKKFYTWERSPEDAMKQHSGLVRDHPPFWPWHLEHEFYAYEAPPGEVTLCSDIQEVTGEWRGLAQIVGIQTREVVFGTQRTNTSIDTATHTAAVEVGIRASAGVFFGEVEASASFRSEWSRSHTEEISTTRTESSKFSVTLGMEHQGRYLWQFHFTTRDSCMATSQTFTKAYALTESAVQMPCCYPGHCLDLELQECNWCNPGYILPAMELVPRCGEGKPPCAEGSTAQLLNGLNGYVTLEQELQSDEDRIVDCPQHFCGTAIVSCNLGVPAVTAQSCRLDCA